jgi:hypothetical protein
MSFKLWLSAVAAGTVAGGAAGLVAGNASDGLGPGAISAGIGALILGHIFRGSDTDSEKAFIASGPYSGMFGGIMGAVITGAGMFGAFVGGGAGFSLGIMIPVMLALK